MLTTREYFGVFVYCLFSLSLIFLVAAGWFKLVVSFRFVFVGSLVGSPVDREKELC